MTMTSPRYLHVANGTSTTATIEDAGIPGRTSIWADPLHEGPVPGHLADERLLEVRARHLAGDADAGLEPAGTLAELQRWRQVIDDHASYDELVLWYEHDLFDQLNLIQVLDRIGLNVRGHKPVSLICIDAFPGHPRFKGLGELTPDELGPLFDTRRPITDGQYDLAARAWGAFRADSPLPLDALLRTDTSALPFLAAALARHLEDYPSTRDGLSRTERRVMSLAQSAPIDISTAFPRMHDDETAFYIADSSFWWVVTELRSTTPPLVAVIETSSAPGQLPTGTIALTDTGRAVVVGHADRVALCGLDRWLGGVHLMGTQPVWRWDHAPGRICRAQARTWSKSSTLF
jgi:hypothetical protein